MSTEFGSTRIDWQNPQAVAQYYGYVYDGVFEEIFATAKETCPGYATVSVGSIIMGRILAAKCPPLTKDIESGSNHLYRPLGTNI